jgi:hypothetical protein
MTDTKDILPAEINLHLFMTQWKMNADVKEL